MAPVGGMGELSNHGGQQRMMGHSTDIIDVNAMAEAEIQAMEMENAPHEARQEELNEELEMWQDLSTDLGDVTTRFGEIKDFDTTQKRIDYSQEGVVHFDTDENAAVGEYDVMVNQLATRQQVSGEDVGSTSDALGMTGASLINGEELEITEDMSLRDIAEVVNRGDFEASATIVNNRLMLSSEETGEENALQLEDADGTVMQEMGVIDADGDVTNTIREAQDAVFSVNGIEETSASNTVEDMIDGVTMDLQGVSEMPVQVQVEEDEEAMMEEINDFVEYFNAALGVMQSYTGEEGPLQGESLPLSIQRSLTNLGGFISEAGYTLRDVGIEMTGMQDNLQLDFNEEQFRDALENDRLGTEETIFGEEGIASFVEEQIAAYSEDGGQIDTRTDSIEADIRRTEETLERNAVRHEMQQESMMRRLASFESMMAGLTSELSGLEAQFQNLNNNS